MFLKPFYHFTMRHIRYFQIHKCTHQIKNNGNLDQFKKKTEYLCFDKFNDQRILELCDEFVPGDPPEYFFDKNPENFSAILELHRSVNIFKTKDMLIADLRVLKIILLQYGISLLNSLLLK